MAMHLEQLKYNTANQANIKKLFYEIDLGMARMQDDMDEKFSEPKSVKFICRSYMNIVGEDKAKMKDQIKELEFLPRTFKACNEMVDKYFEICEKLKK